MEAGRHRVGARGRIRRRRSNCRCSRSSIRPAGGWRLCPPCRKPDRARGAVPDHGADHPGRPLFRHRRRVEPSRPPPPPRHPLDSGVSFPDAASSHRGRSRNPQQRRVARAAAQPEDGQAMKFAALKNCTVIQRIRTRSEMLPAKPDLRRNPTPYLPILLLAALFFAALSAAHAQSAESPEALFKTVQGLDTQLFDAYNHCDLATLSAMVSDDLEFYHDKTGLATGRQVFIDAIKNNICGKVTRELVPGTLEVYPLAHYGAVEIGIHQFHHPGQA